MCIRDRPWTLPANVGIALHPRFTYVAGKFMKDGQTETLVIVKELLDAFEMCIRDSYCNHSFRCYLDYQNLL